MALSVGQHAKHCDLAVVDLAQSPRPLPRHTHRTIALLGKAALVDDQATRQLATQQTIRVLADLGQYWLVIPRRVLLRAAIVNHGRHRGKGTVLRLRQSAQVSSRHHRVVARLGAEELAVAADEDRESIRHRLDQRSGQTSSEHTVT